MRQQFAILAALILAALAAAAIATLAPVDYFHAYFGDIAPLLAMALVAALAAAALLFLQPRGWFDIGTREKTRKGVARAAALATAFAVAVIVVDLTLRFPRDLNVPLPWSLAFYPAMGFVAETVFHLLPLALLLAALGPLVGRQGRERLVWACILLVSLLEPAFQIRAALSEGTLSWREAYVGLHVFLFSLLQLAVFRRYDFVSMLTFRLVYYAYWHIAWGHARLQLLF